MTLLALLSSAQQLEGGGPFDSAYLRLKTIPMDPLWQSGSLLSNF